MPGRIGIVIAAQSKLIRRIVVPDDDVQLSRPDWAGPDELLLVENRAGLLDQGIPVLEVIKSRVAERVGPASSSGRCAVISRNGDVIDVIMADPAIDDLNDHHDARYRRCRLVLSDEAGQGWRWTQQDGFIAPPEPVADDAP